MASSWDMTSVCRRPRRTAVARRAVHETTARPVSGSATGTSGLPVCTLCVVTRLNVYLPDELAAQAKEAGLNLSAVTQEAVRRSLAQRSTDTWLAAVPNPSAVSRVSHARGLDALDAARDEAPTHHG